MACEERLRSGRSLSPDADGRGAGAVIVVVVVVVVVAAQEVVKLAGAHVEKAKVAVRARRKEVRARPLQRVG